MSASYFKAAMPEPHRILGQRLKPFSLGHYLILSRFDSPFVCEAQEITRDDLLFAVLVCAHTYEEFFAFVESPDFDKKVQAWGAACGVFDAASKCIMFEKYLAEGTQCPKFWNEREAESAPSGTHWSQAILLTLTGNLGYSRSAALNAPFTQAASDYLRHCETQGAVRMMTDAEIAMISELEKAGQEAAGCGA